MALSIGAISAEFIADTRGFIKSVGEAEKGVNNFVKNTGKAVTNIGDSMSSLGKSISIKFTAPLVAAFGLVSTQAVNQVKQVQNASAGLKAYEKDAEKVSRTLAGLVDYAQSDMGVLFQRQDLFDAASTLKIYGNETEGLVDKVKILSKGVAIGKTTFQDLSNIVGRVGATGKLTAVDFDMLIERGIGLDKSMRGTDITAQELFKSLDKALPDELLKGRADSIEGRMIRLNSAFRNLGHIIIGTNKDANGFMPGSIGERVLNTAETFRQFIRSEEVTEILKHSVERLGQALDFLGLIGNKISQVWSGLSLEQKKVITDITLLVAGIGPLLIIIGGLIKIVGLTISGLGGLALIIGAVTTLAFIFKNELESLAKIGLEKVIQAVEWLRQKWNEFLPVLKVVIATFVMFGAQVLAAFLYAWEQLRPAVESLWKEFQKLWEVISPIVMAIIGVVMASLVPIFQIAFAILVQVIKGFILALEGLIQFFRGFIQIVRGIFQGDFGMILEGVKAMFTGFAKMLISIFQMFFMGPLKGVVDGIKNVFTGIDFFRIGMDWIKSLTNGIKSKIGGAGKAIRDGLSGMIPEGLKGKIPGFANGVTNFEGGLAVVGERGPELVNLPKGSDVFTNSETKDMMRGSGSNITNNFTVNNLADAEYLSRRLALQLRTN